MQQEHIERRLENVVTELRGIARTLSSLARIEEKLNNVNHYILDHETRIRALEESEAKGSVNIKIAERVIWIVLAGTLASLNLIN